METGKKKRRVEEFECLSSGLLSPFSRLRLSSGLLSPVSGLPS
ncbi:MAG: hypothetical protein U9N32_06835 [Spirochaetota bacterium]|nr:hypothetical protein [Spirochaetota bacterium]